jgi:hypothetical protein
MVLMPYYSMLNIVACRVDCLPDTSRVVDCPGEYQNQTPKSFHVCTWLMNQDSDQGEWL